MHCQVLYLRSDKAMAFESCEAVVRREADSGGESVLLDKVELPAEGGGGEGGGGGGRGSKNKHKKQRKVRYQDVGKVLSQHRRESEVGAFPDKHDHQQQQKKKKHAHSGGGDNNGETEQRSEKGPEQHGGSGGSGGSSHAKRKKGNLRKPQQHSK